MTTTTFQYTDVLPLGPDHETEYRLVTAEGVRVVEAAGRKFLEVDPGALTKLARTAITDIQHLLRSSHLAQLRAIVDDPEASGNDRFVAMDLLRNAAISAGGVLPMCQDTGTAIVIGKRSQGVLTGGNDEQALARGIFDAYQELNLRYSQMAPVSFWEEKNTGTNLPAQIELYHKDGAGDPSYEFLFMAKGGGSANKTFLYQETKAVLNPKRLAKFLDEKLRSSGPRPARRTTWRSWSAACRPSTTSRSPSSPRPAIWTTCRARARHWATASGTPTWSSRCWK